LQVLEKGLWVGGVIELANQDTEHAHEAKGLERLIGLTDDVFAFAITVLVLDLVAPSILGPETNASLTQGLQKESSLFLNYFVSFWVIGILWLGHHRIFRYIRSSDSGLLILNLVFLFFVVLVPFSTRILDAYTHVPLSSILFALILTGASLMTALIWRYASNRSRHLMSEGTSPLLVRWLWVHSLVAPAIFCLSMALALVNTYAPIVSWLAIFPVLMLVDRHYRKRMPQSI